ncbi:HSPA1s [Lepeophtheirus salmonis]|uniref:HSPA1s n=1 Tax=Lepeophtheirus salmonis TaxID=72036 RepID=A0A7R8D413_LEPSM|nr:HSPA1s [Lepeophtheirus salmonis]CAF2989585.1 HSPA1s [Lepeophtheirus salmonis]
MVLQSKAAILAGAQDEAVSDCLLSDVAPLSMGIETAGGQQVTTNGERYRTMAQHTLSKEDSKQSLQISQKTLDKSGCQDGMRNVHSESQRRRKIEITLKHYFRTFILLLIVEEHSPKHKL